MKLHASEERCYFAAAADCAAPSVAPWIEFGRHWNGASAVFAAFTTAMRVKLSGDFVGLSSDAFLDTYFGVFCGGGVLEGGDTFTSSVYCFDLRNRWKGSFSMSCSIRFCAMRKVSGG